MRRRRGAAVEGGCLSHGGEGFQMPHYLITKTLSRLEQVWSTRAPGGAQT
jgi:hypothetical protein